MWCVWATDLMDASYIREQFILVAFVIFEGAVKTDGRKACQAVEVQALVLVLCACAFLLRNGLFALFELFDGLQGVVLAKLNPAVVLRAGIAHE